PSGVRGAVASRSLLRPDDRPAGGPSPPPGSRAAASDRGAGRANRRRRTHAEGAAAGRTTRRRSGGDGVPGPRDRVRLLAGGLRDGLMPANRMWPRADVEAAVHDWREHTRRRPSIEWAMIRDVNDDDRQATHLVPIARRLRAHVNLIPMNPILGSPWQPSTR